MENIVLVIAILFILLGIAGTVFPLIPGIPLAFLAIAAYGWQEGFQVITPKYLSIIGGLTIFSLLVDYLSTYFGAKYFGSSKEALYAAIIGSVLGFFILPPLGIILFPFLGAVLAEYYQDQNWNTAFRTGVGTLIGFFSGILFKLIIGIIILISFLVIVF
jgi:hypothetical protein